MKWPQHSGGTFQRGIGLQGTIGSAVAAGDRSAVASVAGVFIPALFTWSGASGGSFSAIDETAVASRPQERNLFVRFIQLLLHALELLDHLVDIPAGGHVATAGPRPSAGCCRGLQSNPRRS